MRTLLHTRHTEQATLLLAKHYRHVVLRGTHYLSTRIRVDRSKLGKDLYLGRNADHAEGQVNLWRAQGGILLNYRNGQFPHPHEAQVFCECPLSPRLLKFHMANTLAAVVVYLPPSWQHHEYEVGRLAPSVEACAKVISAIGATGLTSTDAAVLATLGLPARGVVALTDDALAEASGVPLRHLSNVMRCILAKSRWEAWCRVLPIVPRVAPREPGLMDLYKYIEALPSLNGVRLAQEGELSKVVRHGKVQVKALERVGSVHARPRMGFYVRDKVAPDMAVIAKRNEKARADLRAIIQMVEAAPELTQWSLARVQGARRPRLPASGSPEQSAGEEPAADNLG